MSALPCWIDWLWAFLFTEAVEVPIYLLAMARRPAPRPFGQTLAIAAGASLLTHPVVWFVFPLLLPQRFWLMALCAELFAFLAEAAYLAAFGVRHPVRLSLLANAASTCAGLLSSAWLGWP